MPIPAPSRSRAIDTARRFHVSEQRSPSIRTWKPLAFLYQTQESESDLVRNVPSAKSSSRKLARECKSQFLTSIDEACSVRAPCHLGHRGWACKGWRLGWRPGPILTAGASIVECINPPMFVAKFGTLPRIYANVLLTLSRQALD